MGIRICWIALCLMLAARGVSATDGFFDSTWPGGGTFVFNGNYSVPTADSFVTSIRVESNGSLLLNGWGFSTGGADFWWLGELLPNGQFVPTFGASDGTGRATSCAIATCTSFTDFGRVALPRPNGSYVVLTSIEVWQTTAQAHALDTAGVVGGKGYVGNVFTINDAQGAVTTGAGHAMALQPADGKLLVAGNGTNTKVSTDKRFGVVRLNTDLSLDSGFNAVTDNQNITFSGGAVVTVVAADTNESVTEVLVQPDGRIVLVGWGTNAGATVLEAVRLTSSGTPDPSFGSNGVAALTWPFGAITNVDAAVLDSAGRIVVALDATGGEPAVKGFMVARLNSDGSPDLVFGTAAFAYDTIPECTGMSASAIAVDTAGRIVVAGQCDAGSGGFAVERLRGDTGAIDNSFGASGFSRGYFSPATTDSNSASTIAFDHAGHLLVGGSGRSLTGDGTVVSGIARLTYDLIYTANFDAFPRGCLSPDCN